MRAQPSRNARAALQLYSIFLLVQVQIEMAEGKFSYHQIYEYIHGSVYPYGYGKEDKRSLRKRSRYFQVKEGSLFYTGGPGT